jgi:hypothetical protein
MEDGEFPGGINPNPEGGGAAPGGLASGSDGAHAGAEQQLSMSELLATILQAKEEMLNFLRGERERRDKMPTSKSFAPAVGKVKEFKGTGFSSELSPREWWTHAKTKFSSPSNTSEEEEQVRRASSSLTGPALLQWNEFLRDGAPTLSWASL